MAQILFSQHIDRVLEEIEEYSALSWGDARAERYIRAIFHAFDLLAENPELGRYRAD
ncbi:MAG: type II toxin-antitoxin system RelE/ParE family toxin, partial [Elstera sp.]